MKRMMTLMYGGVAYVLFFGTFCYLIGFVGNLTPVSIDSPAQEPLGLALLVNLGLVALFGLQHSVMARPAFKAWIAGIVPKPAERSTFVLATVAVLVLLMWQWRPLGGTLWQVEDIVLRAAIYSAFFFGWLLVLVSTFLIDHFDLFGLRQVWLEFQGRAYTPVGFTKPWLYQQVRHPLCLGLIIALWAAPTMTTTHLVLASGLTVYIRIAVSLEERDLRAAHPEYAAYSREVPMLFPRVLGRGRSDDRVRRPQSQSTNHRSALVNQNPIQ